MEIRNSIGKKSDLEQIDREIRETNIKDEYSLKKHIMTPQVPTIDGEELENLFALITKDLALANINDDYTKYIYQMHLRNAMNWFVAGLKDLAIIRLANLIGELQLERSKEALERLLQASAPLSGAIVFYERGRYKFLKNVPVQEEEEKEEKRGD